MIRVDGRRSQASGADERGQCAGLEIRAGAYAHERPFGDLAHHDGRLGDGGEAGGSVLLDDGVVPGIGFDDDTFGTASSRVTGLEAEVDDRCHDPVGESVHGRSCWWCDEQVHPDVVGSGGQDVLRDEAVGSVGLDVEAVVSVDGSDPAGVVRGVSDALQIGSDLGFVEFGHHPVVGARMGEPLVDSGGVAVDVERADGHCRRGGRELARFGDEFGGHACDISLESSSTKAAEWAPESASAEAVRESPAAEFAVASAETSDSSAGTPKVWKAMVRSIGYGSRPVTAASTTEARQGPKPRSGAVTPWVCSSPLRTWMVPSSLIV